MSSAALGDISPPASEPSSSAYRPSKPLRHVAFFIDRDEVNDNEKTPTTRTAGRRGVQPTMTADEHRAWSTRAAESDALRQRALQCGEDIARVASGLGYEVVTCTPTVFLKYSSASTAVPTVAVKSEVEPRWFAAADDAPPHVVDSAASPHSPSAGMPSLIPPVFLKEDDFDSCSSRSSSLGTEEQVGLVPVLSPLLHTEETGMGCPYDEETVPTFEVTLPRALSAHESTSHYSFAETSTHFLRPEQPSRRDDNDQSSPPFGFVRENFLTVRPDNTANRHLRSSFNSLGERSTTSTSQSSLNASPLSRLSVTPRRAGPGRNHSVPDNLLGTNQSVFQLRATMVDVASSSRATSNANTSVSTEPLNGLEPPAVGVSRNASRPLTPATDALNTPSVRLNDDDIWPRSNGRPIQ
ncbi:hypothetical protein ABB37_04672 [Leptomonas pyrrhocoris]|uniref:Uncharacterized protein n=1 Tax=Leptomonas pyrrhocoris TaxID=157538 RepID=A0A0N0VFA4_LEPPY|nr:hypothetical protein ABB37_04672 [Leptomonas pyrrhocoris]KPA80444.1 hypothetical protein ABB37_04672 [Leptomonas pyrrhocoris]|eukprot:XP_015658883.1 hypothetical protein ABB37_04672 [Leptomonas pyrrhocoris]